MQSVIAFDVSMGKSYMNRSVTLVRSDGQAPAIVFEATVVYSGKLERFMNDYGFSYGLLNPLESKLQTASMRMHKTDKSDAYRLAQTHFTTKRRVKEHRTITSIKCVHFRDTIMI
ncbi:IS110 family transposase [Bacillus cytotoxicus]|uniref:IS110 family transposase n=1 Tax=Bacillus cytotoxicus TaxID=580165 RepID=UPI003B987581